MTILEARKEAGLTQKQVFELIGVPVRTLQNWENGIRVCPQYVEDLLVEKLLSLKERDKDPCTIVTEN
jgi:transcriptional regulator with XRE-family HTH domain